MGKEGLREVLKEITKEVLAELSPERCLSCAVRLEGERLCAGPYRYDLRRFRRVLVLGFGKASVRMAQGLEEILGPRISAGFVVTAEGCSLPTRIVEVAEAGHPLPDERTIQAAMRIWQMVRDADKNDLLIFLISGGGSALFELPAAGLALEDIVRTTDLLLRSGATIHELNAVRKHLSQVKGGKIAQLAWPARVLGLVLSDVPGDDLSTIASGPLYPDPTTFAQAVEILRRHGVWEEVPSAVRDRLSRGAEGRLPETPKPGDPCFSKVRHVIVGSGRTALAAAQGLGHKMGFRTLVLTSTLRGEAREVGKFFAGLAEEEREFDRPVRPPALLLAAGETTVTVRGKGLGGRNQELALAFALEIQGLSSVALLSLATDGKDGPTDAAGAIVDGGSAERMRKAGIDPKEALLANDSYHALFASGDLLRIGPTGTNVADLVILGVERRKNA